MFAITDISPVTLVALCYSLIVFGISSGALAKCHLDKVAEQRVVLIDVRVEYR